MHPPPDGADRPTAAQGSHGQPATSIAVTVLGNSNTVVRYSYANILQKMPDISLQNASMGDNSGVFLLDPLTRPAEFKPHFVIVETSVIDAQWTRLQRQTVEGAREGLELFLTAVRRVTAARIVLLVLPVRSVLLQNEPHWVEQMADDLAARFGVEVLNVYRLLRPMLAHWKRDPRNLEETTRSVLAAFEFPDRAWLDFLWQTAMRFPWSPLTAFHRAMFADELHIGNAVQALVAEILLAWIRANASDAPAGFTAPPGAPLVRAAGPRPGFTTVIQRKSSLLSRDLHVLEAAQSLTYAAPPGYRAAGLTINRGSTHAIVRLTGGDGRSTAIDMRFTKLAMPFVANIAPFADDVGDGEFTVDIVPTSDGIGSLHRYWDTVGTQRPAVAEVGSLLLVRRDWRKTLPPPSATAPPIGLEQTRWAAPLIEDFVAKAEAGAAAGETAALGIVAPLLDSLATAAAPAALQSARLRLAAGQFDAALEALQRLVAENPDDARAQKQADSLTALKTLLKR